MIPLAAGARRLLWRSVLQANGGLGTRGALPPGGCVVVANHCSHADAPSILAAIDARHRPMVAAAADYWFDRPGKALVARGLVGGFPVRRDGGGYRDLAAHADALRDGQAVVVFPAGSRRATDGRFRLGAFRLAAEAGVPVVPVRLTGTARLLPPSGRPHRSAVTVDIGEPVDVTDPAVTAAQVERDLCAPAVAVATPGLRQRIARLAASAAGIGLAAAWAFAEATIWPTTPPMNGQARAALGAHGLGGLWSQPLSGIPYKVYARAAGQDGIGAAPWLAMSLAVRASRLVAVALLAALAQRATRRWQRLYTRAVALGVVAFVVSLCLIVSSWSARP